MGQKLKRIPAAVSERAPFITADDDIFANLVFNHGVAHTIDLEEVGRFLEAAAPGDFIIARRLTADETQVLLHGRFDADSDVFATLVPDRARWTPTRRRRSR